MQVDAAHYHDGYLTRERWISFVYQVTALQGRRVERVAELGVGPGVVGDMMRATYPQCCYVGVDIDPALEPDVCADVGALPFPNGAFDAVFCCQVLEHLPFARFETALSELLRITSGRLVLSLPDVTPFFFLRMRGARRLWPALWRGFDLPNLRPTSLRFEDHGQHHWEIGRKGYPASRIIEALNRADGTLVDRFRMVERPYWRFFLIDKHG